MSAYAQNMNTQHQQRGTERPGVHGRRDGVCMCLVQTKVVRAGKAFDKIKTNRHKKLNSQKPSKFHSLSNPPCFFISFPLSSPLHDNLGTCPRAGAWAASASAKNDHVSNKVECSSRGKCDRSSGECTCEEGYAGSACQRTVCPNSCNGHGTCQSLSQIADDFSHNADDGAASALFAVPNSDKDCDNCIGTQNTGARYDSAWDASRAQGCKCDAGYRGPDCSLKECPSGDDTLEGHGGSKGRACSGRGSCDYESGQCVCYTGFYGHRCQSMTVLA